AVVLIRDVAEDTGAKNPSPLHNATVACPIATNVSKVTSAFETQSASVGEGVIRRKLQHQYQRPLECVVPFLVGATDRSRVASGSQRFLRCEPARRQRNFFTIIDVLPLSSSRALCYSARESVT